MEYWKENLDEFVCSILSPIFSRLFSKWNPHEDPKFMTQYFVKWKSLFKNEFNGTCVDVSRKEMSNFECLMYSVWMPKIRSAIV